MYKSCSFAPLILIYLTKSITQNKGYEKRKYSDDAPKFVVLSGASVTIDPTVDAGAIAIIGTDNGNGTYRTMTFVNGGDGTYTIKYNPSGTLSNTETPIYLKGTFNNWGTSDVFRKTANSDVVTLTKELAAGTYSFKLYNAGTEKWYGRNNTSITDTVNRVVLSSATGTSDCSFTATGGEYEFRFELSTNRLSVYKTENTAMAEQPTVPEIAGYLLGDTDGNGYVDIRDVTDIQRHLVNLKRLEGVFLKAANVNGDDYVDINDATMLQFYLAQFVVPYPIGEYFTDNDAQM